MEPPTKEEVQALELEERECVDHFSFRNFC